MVALFQIPDPESRIRSFEPTVAGFRRPSQFYKGSRSDRDPVVPGLVLLDLFRYSNDIDQSPFRLLSSVSAVFLAVFLGSHSFHLCSFDTNSFKKHHRFCLSIPCSVVFTGYQLLLLISFFQLLNPPGRFTSSYKPPFHHRPVCLNILVLRARPTIMPRLRLRPKPRRKHRRKHMPTPCLCRHRLRQRSL